MRVFGRTIVKTRHNQSRWYAKSSKSDLCTLRHRGNMQLVLWSSTSNTKSTKEVRVRCLWSAISIQLYGNGKRTYTSRSSFALAFYSALTSTSTLEENSSLCGGPHAPCAQPRPTNGIPVALHDKTNIDVQQLIRSPDTAAQDARARRTGAHMILNVSTVTSSGRFATCTMLSPTCFASNVASRE